MDGPAPIKREDDWIKGNPLALAQRVSEADPFSATAWQRLYLGDAAMRLMRGVADAKEVGKVMGHLIAQCEIEVEEGTKRLLLLDDLTTAEARAIHFDTRVSAAIVSRMNQLVRDGIAAAAELEDTTQGLAHEH